MRFIGDSRPKVWNEGGFAGYERPGHSRYITARPHDFAEGIVVPAGYNPSGLSKDEQLMNQIKKFLCLGIVLAATTVTADDGKTKAMACSACHGMDGNSTMNPEWPNLAGQHSSYTVAQLQAFKSGTRKNALMNGMAASLSDEDMADIADYYSGQSLKVASVKAEEVAAGAALYRGGNRESGVPACMACHGPNGAGNPGALYPAVRGQHAKYAVLQLQAYKSGERATDPKEIMRTIAARLTTEEIENVAKFMEGLH